MDKEFWKMTIEDLEGNMTIYTAGTRERLEKILGDLNLQEDIKIEIKKTTNKKIY